MWDKGEHPQHKVTIGKSFYMQTTEVTVGQWRAFIEGTGFRTDAETEGWAWIWTGKKWEKKEGYYWNNPGFSQSEENPVTCVSWNNIQEFIRWLSRKQGKIYRLPTEAEWEYACRAGTRTRFSWGNGSDCSKANYGSGYSSECKGRNPGRTMEVGSFPPNPWGLYDVHGNVWEWCQDWYGYYPTGHVTDPKGPSSGKYRAFRGGSWNGSAWYCRSAFRSWYYPDHRNGRLGFRVARDS